MTVAVVVAVSVGGLVGLLAGVVLYRRRRRRLHVHVDIERNGDPSQRWE